VDQAGEWPIPIIATQDVACGVKLWSTAGRSRATVVVKATFFLVRGGPMRLVAPAPILLGDQHHEGSVDRSVLAASDVSPYLPRGEVLFAGHAYAPTPSPFVPVRLAIVGSRPLIDKTLHVYGERMWIEGDQTTAPVPFTRIPIRYERAYRGAAGFEENPLGMAKAPGQPVHNIIDPADPEAPAGFGPIAPYWPPRRRLLRNLDPSAVLAPRPDLPDTFAWSFYHAAPPDQRCSFFEGNEWVVLEGLHPEHPRFESQLPGARARARLYSQENTSFREVGLAADTLWIDGDHSLCCVLYRGNFEVDSSASLDATQLFAGLEMPGRTIPWPDAPSAGAPEIAQAAGPPDITMHSPSPVARAGSGSYAAVNPNALGQGAPIRPPSGQYAAVAGPNVASASPPVAAPGAGAGSRLAALAQDAAPARAQGFNAAATLANPGAVAAAMGDARRANVQISDQPSDGYMRVDAAWLEDSGQRASPAPAQSPTTNIGNTLTQPPSELRNLLRQQAHDEEARSKVPTARHVDFEDMPTVAPDTGDLERILAEAELAAEVPLEDKRPDPIGARPSPPAARAQKTTIRGLGLGVSREPEPPPPTARVTTANLLGSQESPTAQLPIPEILLKLAAQPASSRAMEASADALPTPSPAAPSEPPPTTAVPAMLIPVGISPAFEPQIADLDLDEDDTGRPTLSGMEAPPVTLAHPLQVHKGEARMELERRIREGEPLDGLDLSDLDLSGFDLAAKRLTGCRFDRAILKRARFCSADLTSASFEGADVGEGDFEDAVLERANFVSAKLSGANLRRTLLTDANFTTCDGRRASFDGASGQRTLLSRARLDGASAVGVKLDGADLTEAQVDGASFDDALMPDLKAYEVSAEDTSFLRASMGNARFDGAVLSRARFDGAQVEDSMWDRAVLDGASFEAARLTGASFTKASLRGVNLSGADLAEARFNRANLTGARFVGVDLGALTLDGADLTGIVTGD
jgi:uncharacterized protein YjbI with pentapeptide repeats